MRIYLKRVALIILAGFSYLTVFYVFPGALNMLEHGTVQHDDKRYFKSPDAGGIRPAERRNDGSSVRVVATGNATSPRSNKIVDETVLGYVPDNTQHEVLYAEKIRLKEGAGIWYNKERPHEDRILSQMKHVPRRYAEAMAAGRPPKPKVILKFNRQVERGDVLFHKQNCPVNRCEFTDDRNLMSEVDAVLFDHTAPPRMRDHSNTKQVWIYFELESPLHSGAPHTHHINWTATYRHESTIVAPYAKFALYNSSQTVKPQNRNYAAGKSKKIAWFVSNCAASNERGMYVKKLQEYIDVDIYGRCGPLKCSREDHKSCFGKLNTDYKFYLAFENSNCLDYITEKFFLNGLEHDVIPIVMGAPLEHYTNSAPHHSFIHVDQFSSPEELAKYLHTLDQNNDLYNEYFQWKGTGEYINTFFNCRMCAMLHAQDEREASWYEDVGNWWHNDVCIGNKSWRDVR